MIGDTVHIVTESHSTIDIEGALTVYHINDKENLLIVNPDLLISGTVVVNSYHCMRR